jgi:ribonuclease R
VALDDPFVEVLVRFESMGPDHYNLSEDELSIVGSRSGDTISLGDRMAVVIEDVAIMRRTVYARRVVPEAILNQLSEPASGGGSGRSFEKGGKGAPRRFAGHGKQHGPSSGRPERDRGGGKSGPARGERRKKSDRRGRRER